MIQCKKNIIAICFALIPLTGWSEAPIVDDSDNFAIVEEQQADEPSVVRPQNDEPLIERSRNDRVQNDNYQVDQPLEDGPALVKEDASNETGTESSRGFNDNAKLIDKIQSLQQEIQELRGQLEVQAHDLKLLQQQQVAFYKDLDSRLGASAGTLAKNKPATDLSSNSTPLDISAPATQTKVEKAVVKPLPVIAVSRINPADEQISYLAAYELVKKKKYDAATLAMQTFVQKYPRGGYTANAEYWLGELYLVKKNYPYAIEHFDVVLKQFPTSSKSAASMLKAGYAYAASGNKEEAKKRLQQVVSTWPDTRTAELASSKLATL